jgi:hypothetical protein
MKRLMCWLVAVVALAGVVASMAPRTGQAGQEAAPIFVTDMPPGYRDWRLISVAHEAGDLNDIRAILGHDVAIKAYREGTRPFPDGPIIARLAWSDDASEEHNRVFGRPQSFVAGPPKNGVQFMVKDANTYAATGGWGFAHFPTAPLPTRRCSTPAFPATRRSTLATWSSPNTPCDPEHHRRKA